MASELVEKAPILLNGIVTFTRWSVEQPSYNLETFNLVMGDAVFVKDFGVWKKGDRPHTLIFNVFLGILTESDQFELVVRSCPVRLEPVMDVRVYQW